MFYALLSGYLRIQDNLIMVNTSSCFDNAFVLFARNVTHQVEMYPLSFVKCDQRLEVNPYSYMHAVFHK